MFSAVLLLSLLAAIDPVRIGITALLIARPRPMLNLFAFWLGGIVAGVSVAFAVLFFLRDVTLAAIRAVDSATSSPIVAYLQVSVGALALSAAALLIARSWARHRPTVPASTGQSTNLLLEPNTSSVSGRLSIRGRLASGSISVAFIAGAALATPPVEYMAAMLAIVASERAAPAQVAAALAFTVVAFTVVEVPLITYLTAPARTMAVVRRVHVWISERRQAIPVLVVSAMGFMLLASGMGRI